MKKHVTKEVTVGEAVASPTSNMVVAIASGAIKEP